MNKKNLPALPSARKNKQYTPVSYREEPRDIHGQKERELEKLKADQDELAGITEQLNSYKQDPLIMLTQRSAVSALEQRAAEITRKYGSRSALDRQVAELTKKVNDPKVKYLNSPDYRSQYQRLLDLGAGGQSVQNNFAEAGLEYLTPEERGAYNYHYYKHGKNKADEYLAAIQGDVNARRAAEIAEDTTIEDAPILSNIMKLKQGYDSGIDTWQQNMRHSGDLLRGNDRYVTPSAQQLASAQIRQQMADRGLAFQIAYDVATGIGQMTPSLLTSTVADVLIPGSGKVLGAGMMGLSSAGGAYREAINRGYSADQARGYGILTGVSEVGMKYLLDGITKLGGKVNTPMIEKLSGKVKNVLAKVADTYGGKMLSEFGEEYLQSVFTPVYQNLTLGTEQDVDLLSEDALYEAFIAAISSGFVEGGAQISNHNISVGTDSAQFRNNKSKSGGIRFTLKDAEIPTWDQLAQKPPIPVVDISKPKTTGRFAERRRTIKNNLDSIISKPYYNSDTGTFIFLTEKSYTHTYGDSKNPKNNTNRLKELQINASEHLPELVENAVLTHVEPADHGSDYTENVYTFFSAAKADSIHPIKLKIKEYRYEGQRLPKNIAAFFQKMPRDYSSAYDTRVLYVDTIEEGLPSSVKDRNNKASALNPDRPSEISVTDLLGLVNTDYQKYVPQLKDANGTKNNASNGKHQRINIVNQVPEEDDEKQKKADRQYSRWLEETEAAKRLYGDFDLGAELQNPRFRKLLQSGISVPDAFLAVHQGDILIGATRMGLRLGEEKVNRRIEENRRRPRENGLSPGAPFIAKMSKADRLAIAHRVAKGEKIVF